MVHNGIIENFRALRDELAAKGHSFATETDSEIAAFLVEDELAEGKPPRPRRFMRRSSACAALSRSSICSRARTTS